MTSRGKAILFFCCAAAIDKIVPLPLTAVVGGYIAITRPLWFKELVGRIYRDAPPPLPDPDRDENFEG